MHRFALILAMPLLGAVAMLSTGCADDTNSNLLTPSIGKPTAAPAPGAPNSEPLARSARVASTAARAQICGLAFDPAKLRSSYLAYESKQGLDGAQLSMIEKSYDNALSTIAVQRAAIADRCSAKQVTWTRDRNAEFSEKYKGESKLSFSVTWQGLSLLTRRVLAQTVRWTPRRFGRTRTKVDTS